jgi:predicted SprT family Zn-dependent metalloprotease
MRTTLERILQQKGGRMKMGKQTFYFLERNRYTEQYNTQLTWKECEKIHSKLRRHYKLTGFYHNKIRYNGRICGRAYGSGIIELGKNGLNIGILSHEIAHLIAYKKYQHMRHDKKLWNIMNKVMKYTKKKNYWKTEILRIKN